MTCPFAVRCMWSELQWGGRSWGEGSGLLPRGSIYTTYGIRPKKTMPILVLGDLIP